MRVHPPHPFDEPTRIDPERPGAQLPSRVRLVVRQALPSDG
jgi:hypothetical protein